MLHKVLDIPSVLCLLIPLLALSCVKWCRFPVSVVLCFTGFFNVFLAGLSCLKGTQ